MIWQRFMLGCVQLMRLESEGSLDPLTFVASASGLFIRTSSHQSWKYLVFRASLLLDFRVFTS
uniref:Uncharacterized protein n=1 Tax=Lotus japonicus TaxID=34305 RepID=I3SPB2_LOTJA|nr:unknown [Lotus japonicus]